MANENKTLVVEDAVSFVICDDLGEDYDDSNEVTFQVARYNEQAFVSVCTLDDSVSWTMTQEQWEQFKFQVERVFNQQARSNSNG